MKRLRFVCLVGPTGVGKSALALRVAQTVATGIVNADSRQVYKAFPLITAQPSDEDRALCPHALYGFLATEERLSAGAWARMALDSISRFMEQGRLPLLVGGTGLYLRALTDGIVDIPRVPDHVSRQLAADYERDGSVKLHERLSAIDSEYAARIHPHDRQRVLRALEVFETTGKNFSWWHKQTPAPPDADILYLGVRLPLASLTPFLAHRVDKMLAAGAAEEARAEFVRCPGDAPGWSGIGCKELRGWLRGNTTFAEARELWIRNTRAYAKRQLTWFNADSRILWFEPCSSGDIPDVISHWLAGLL